MADTASPPSPQPRSLASLVVNGVVSVAILAGCVFGYTLLGERERPKRTKPPKSPVTIVTSEPLRLHDGPVPIQANGVVVPLREIRLATEIAGRIVEQSENLRAGKIVEAGEVLIRLDDAEYQLEFERLQAQANQEESEISAADVGIENTLQLLELADEQVALAKADRVRVDSLVQRQAASASEVDTARRAELSAKSELVGLANQRRDLVAQKQLIVDKQSLTEVQLKRALLDLQRCLVRSPIKGLVVTSSVEEQSFVAAGTSFVTIEDTSAVEVRVNLTADQMIWIWNSVRGREDPSRPPGRLPQIAAVVSYSFGTETFRWPATLQRIDGSGIDPNTRTYPCLFRVDSPAASSGGVALSRELAATSDVPSSRGVPSTRRLARSMFVGVTIQTSPSRVLYEVPESAIRPGNRLWLNADGQLQITPVTIVSNTGDRFIVDVNQATNSTTLASTSVILSPISDPVQGMAVGDVKDQKSKTNVVKQPGKDAAPGKAAS